MISIICLQIGYALGMLSLYVAGRKLWIGWALGVLSEVFFAGWATFSHTYSAYPWVLLWTAIYFANWLKWTRTRYAQPR